MTTHKKNLFIPSYLSPFTPLSENYPPVSKLVPTADKHGQSKFFTHIFSHTRFYSPDTQHLTTNHFTPSFLKKDNHSKNLLVHPSDKGVKPPHSPAFFLSLHLPRFCINTQSPPLLFPPAFFKSQKTILSSPFSASHHFYNVFIC